MARYTGPKHKLARREGINILDKQSESLRRRLNIPPGGLHNRRIKKRISEYGEQLREKQKAKYIYGLLEKQFKNLIKKVEQKKGDTGEMLMELLETRLDSIVYRLSFAKTRTMARQLVSHGHIFINGKRVNIPSYQVRVNDVVSISPKIQKTPPDTNTLPFLKREDSSGKLIRIPNKDDIHPPFDLQLIIEYYSR